ncbi:uncharacterized protein LOC143914060 [Arctopsyche grandis]|uniref:uncharacterized protein LOC143914060 n=1 Tax=Arctopsyche grandis TaxID=121162 RepID=UPI00406D716C
MVKRLEDVGKLRPAAAPKCIMSNGVEKQEVDEWEEEERVVRVRVKPPPKEGVTKSNPSKRHRERLNAELDTLASLLPFEQNILSKLDRLSILRLSVSYLRTKSYFQVVMHKDKEDGMLQHESSFRSREMTAYDHSLLDGDMFLQALNGFLMILTCEGEVFFATHSIESYLGFHQSDIVHQSVYELVHSEDREELQRQLMWNSFLPADRQAASLAEALRPDCCQLLERSFTVRFRCLLDNTSGFLRLDIRGRVKVLHGQNRKTEEPPLALFAICTPFGPPSLLEIPQKEVMFKSKHKLDLALVSMDQRGKLLLGYSDSELANMGGYDLVHYEDLSYVASAHQELLKTGASGMIAYRFQTKEGQWQWLQTSSRLVYKNSKPDFVISTHRPLMEEEGRDLLGKRTMDFKVSYLDAGLTNSYFTDADQLVGSGSPSGGSATGTSPGPQRVNRRYKTQLRDFLSTCRTKRKLTQAPAPAPPPLGVPTDYMCPDSSSVAAVAAAYSNLNTMYPTPYATPAVPTATDNGLAYMGHSANFQHSLYPPASIDNRFLATDNLFHQYRPLGTYYPEYHTATASPYVSNGFLEMSPRGTTCTLPTYDTGGATPHHGYPIAGKSSVMQMDDKIYSCQQIMDPSSPGKYQSYVDASRGYAVANVAVTSPYSVSPGVAHPAQAMTPNSQMGDMGHKMAAGKVSNKQSPHQPDGGAMSSSNSEGQSPVNMNGMVTPKMEELKGEGLAGGSPQQFGETPRQTVLMWGARSPGAADPERAPTCRWGGSPPAPSPRPMHALPPQPEVWPPTHHHQYYHPYHTASQ